MQDNQKNKLLKGFSSDLSNTSTSEDEKSSSDGFSDSYRHKIYWLLSW